MKVLLTGCDHGLGYGMTEIALREGHTVFASQYLEDSPALNALKEQYPAALFPIRMDIGKDESVVSAKEEILKLTESLDAVFSCAGILGEREVEGDPVSDHNKILQVINVNAVGAVRLTESFYPLLKKGTAKKLCFVSSEAGSIGECFRKDWFGYCMSKASLNMYGKLIFNRLTPEGFDVKLYHPGWVRSYMNGYFDEAADLDIDVAAKYAWDYFMGPAEPKCVLRDCHGKEWEF